MYSTNDLFSLAEDYADDSGWLGPALPALFGIAIGCRARDMLEIGVHRGGSTRALLLAAQFNDGSLVSIDVEDCGNVVPVELRSRWSFIRGDSRDVLPRIDRRFDFAYVDGAHCFDAVARELQYLDRAIRPGGTVLLDDCWPDFQGVLDAFNSFESPHPIQKHLLPYGTDKSLFGARRRTFGVIRY
jgi:predicted O-methyltransferase YrrM